MSEPPSDESQAIPYRAGLSVPVVGMEAEFVVLLDGREVEPEAIWAAPADFIRQRVLKRATRASQLATGGAIYFDKGVIELVTPVIEVAPGCTSRMVRSMWEQIAHVRAELERWAGERSAVVKLRGFSAHYNVSFELPREERGRDRTVQKLALLLAHVLPAPVLVAAANRRSTGVGVRPRRDRIEVTVDFTPDPGLMLATAALIAGIAREVTSWPSYRLEELDARGIPRLAGFEPGRHTSRKGWLARAAQFDPDPFTTPIDDPRWKVERHGLMSFRELALRTARPFRYSIAEVSDRFSDAVLFGVLEKKIPSLLDLPDRPPEYDDVGRATRWGSAMPAMNSYRALAVDPAVQRRAADATALGAPWTVRDTERRIDGEGRDGERRGEGPLDAVTPEERLPRSEYENVFIRLVRNDSFRLAGHLLSPLRVEGWYHVVCADAATREEVLVPIEELVRGRVEWI